MSDTSTFEGCYINEHWNFKENLLNEAILSTKYAHSGLKSLRFRGGSVSVTGQWIQS